MLRALRPQAPRTYFRGSRLHPVADFIFRVSAPTHPLRGRCAESPRPPRSHHPRRRWIKKSTRTQQPPDLSQKSPRPLPRPQAPGLKDKLQGHRLQGQASEVSGSNATGSKATGSKDRLQGHAPRIGFPVNFALRESTGGHDRVQIPLAPLVRSWERRGGRARICHSRGNVPPRAKKTLVGPRRTQQNDTFAHREATGGHDQVQTTLVPLIRRWERRGGRPRICHGRGNMQPCAKKTLVGPQRAIFFRISEALESQCFDRPVKQHRLWLDATSGITLCASQDEQPWLCLQIKFTSVIVV
jgi:hypothetical protein